ncbi:MAG: PEGA domain-containing protein [Polyangiaceae bacterium]|nr:PEGA domain-containing protein [Polyangiaceae bacterium]
MAQLLQRAEQARRTGRWVEAEAAYRAASQIERRGDIVGELGVCELELGKARDAAEHLQSALEADDLSADLRRRFLVAQRKARRFVGSIGISVRPADAEVFVDGRSLGTPRLSYTVFVEPGTHTVRAARAGYDDVTAEVDVPRGSSRPFPLSLTRKPGPRPVPAAAAPLPPPERCPAAADCRQGPLETFRYIGFFSSGVGD